VTVEMQGDELVLPQEIKERERKGILRPKARAESRRIEISGGGD
jgi:hypothetical protein